MSVRQQGHFMGWKVKKKLEVFEKKVLEEDLRLKRIVYTQYNTQPRNTSANVLMFCSQIMCMNAPDFDIILNVC